MSIIYDNFLILNTSLKVLKYYYRLLDNIVSLSGVVKSLINVVIGIQKTPVLFYFRVSEALGVGLFFTLHKLGRKP